MKKRAIANFLTFSSSAAALAVSSVALATQPTKVTKEEITNLIPVPVDNTPQVSQMVKDEAQNIKDNYDGKIYELEASFKSLSKLQQVTNEILNKNFKKINKNNQDTFLWMHEITDANKKITESINSLNKKFEELKTENNKSLEAFKKEQKSFIEKINKDIEEIKKLQEHLKTVKGFSDLSNAQTWVSDFVKPYMDEKIKVRNELENLKSEFQNWKTWVVSSGTNMEIVPLVK